MQITVEADNLQAEDADAEVANQVVEGIKFVPIVEQPQTSSQSHHSLELVPIGGETSSVSRDAVPAAAAAGAVVEAVQGEDGFTYITIPVSFRKG